MDNPISQVKVITGIGEAGKEDFVAQSLFDRGMNIHHRALSAAGLIEFVDTCDMDSSRWIIIVSLDLPGINKIDVKNWQNSQCSLLILSLEDLTLTADDLFLMVQRSLRNPLLHSSEAISSKVDHLIGNFIVIIGSTGAPGRSTVALNLAAELALNQSVTLIDADFTSPSLAYLLGLSHQASTGKTNLTNNLTLEIPPKEIFFNQFRSETQTIVDLGALPHLSSVAVDRRLEGHIYISWMEAAKIVIYVCKSEGSSLRSLEIFLELKKKIYPKMKFIFLLNLVGRSRRHRALEKRFSTLVENEISQVLEADFVALDKAQSEYTSIIEAAPRSQLRKGFYQLRLLVEK